MFRSSTNIFKHRVELGQKIDRLKFIVQNRKKKKTQILLPVTLELRNRATRFPQIPPLKPKPKPPRSKLRWRRPLGRRVRNQPIAIPNPSITQPGSITKTHQIHPPILPNTHALHSTLLQIDTRNSSNM